jgi:hypothetical protein
MRLRRLEAEAIRDAILAAAGRMSRALGGPPVPVEPRPDGTFVVSDKLPSPADRYRRSLYLLSRRNYHPTLLGVFDQPNLTAACSRRQTSAVVLQSLTMLNDPFVQEQAEAMARQIASQTGTDRSAQMERAFLLTLGRPPRTREIDWSQAFLKEIASPAKASPTPETAPDRALAHLCHVLLNSSEFLYVP